jgi:hypothetical protein
MNHGVLGRELGKEARLGLAVELHAFVEVQMVAREIRKGRDLEIERVDAMHRQAMARDLEHQMRGARIERLPREARYIVALGGRMKGWAFGARDHEPRRPYQRGRGRYPLEGLLDEISGRRLAVGARNPNRVEHAGRSPIDELRSAAKTSARVWHRELWNTESQELLRHDGGGPSLQRVAHESHPIVRFTRHRDEQVSAGHLARVVLDASHGLRRRTCDPALDAVALEFR